MKTADPKREMKKPSLKGEKKAENLSSKKVGNAKGMPKAKFKPVKSIADLRKIRKQRGYS